jgi:hypothetical protein
MNPDRPSYVPVSRQGLAVLRHPDRSSNWSIVVAASLADATTRRQMAERLEELAAALPITRSRLAGDVWVAGLPAEVLVVDGEALDAPLLTRRYALEREGPLRVVLGAAGTRVAIAGHHGAFDGLALVAILEALLGGSIPAAAPDAPARKGAWQPRETFRRLAHPADRVAPSLTIPARESFVSQQVSLKGRGVTPRLAAASVRAIGTHNAQRGWPWRRIGLSVAVGGHAGVGNVASYRRVDVRPDEAVASRVAAALAEDVEPGELVRAPAAMRMLAPLATRVSDSVLVSNVGRHSLPARRLEFFPVARGRSAVAIGAAGVTPGVATLTVRARDLDMPDARAILERIADGL